MEQRITGIAKLVVCAVLSYATSGCSGGGGASADGQDAVSAGGAADVSGDNAPGGASDDEVQRPGRTISGEAARFARSATELRGLGDDRPCLDCKPRVAEPLPLPAPGPAPFSSAPEMAR
jgi:hypothetical protein